ncbi:hypothetical protein CRM22_004133 [Opisthorchis felineus]|uniref:C2H2-type domain-containing protein n=1 Tax=Opisthorchis felineus TaxID=147828 RepID=A0A4S2LXS1_OPIFE|nr:hypothetical protein CRM22_004133 [Opisthorchis felineus]
MTECTAPLDLRLLTKLHKRKINIKEPARRKRSHSSGNSPDLRPSQSTINTETGTNQHQCKRRIDIFICPICRKHTTCLEGFAEHMALHVTRGSTTTSVSEDPLDSERRDSTVKFSRNNLSPAAVSKTSSQLEAKFPGQLFSSHTTNKDEVATTHRRDDLKTEKIGVPSEKSVCTICCPVVMLPDHLSLKEHIQSNHIKACYQCQCCERYFSSKLACENHIFTHHVGQSTVENLTDKFHETVSYLIPILRTITANPHPPVMLVGGQSMEQQREPSNWSVPTVLPASHVEKHPPLPTDKVNVSEPLAGLLPEIILEVLQHILPTCRSVVQEQLVDDNKSCAATENDAGNQSKSSSTTTKHPSPTQSLQHEMSSPQPLEGTREDLLRLKELRTKPNLSLTSSTTNSNQQKLKNSANGPAKSATTQPGDCWVANKQVISCGPETSLAHASFNSLSSYTSLIYSHPVRSLLPVEIASKVNSLEAAKLCHVCLQEFTDEMAVLRHQVGAHSLDDITNKQKN